VASDTADHELAVLNASAESCAGDSVGR